MFPWRERRSFDDIVARLTRFRQERNVSPDQWLIGFGYDHNQLREKRHPDRRVLDRAAEDGPVLISHASGHMGVVSTQGLVRLGLAADTPDPEGGRPGTGGGRLSRRLSGGNRLYLCIGQHAAAPAGGK